MVLWLVSILIPFVASFLAVSLLWPAPTTLRRDLLLKVSLAAGVGVGVTSASFFLLLILLASSWREIVLVEIALLVVLIAALLLAWRRRRGVAALSSPLPFAPLPLAKAPKVLWAAFFAVLAIAVAGGVRLCWAKIPHGDWDAWAIWNLRARFLFRGGDHWRETFSPPAPVPHYPLLLPASVARGWAYLGREATFVPAVFALTFTFATVGILFASLAVLRSRAQGLLAALVFLSWPLVAQHGSSQCADTPLSFYMLATMVLFCLHDSLAEGGLGLLFLAGLMAGCAAWTKNEGSLFLIALIPARLISLFRSRKWRQLLALGAGLLPLAAVLVYFKIALAPTNDYIAGQEIDSILGRATDWTRYPQIGKAFLRQALAIGPWLLLVLTIYYFLIGGARRDRVRASGAGSCILVLCVMLLGFVAVYAITPQDLNRHLQSSLHRLFLQLWPTAVFAFFLIVATPEEALARTRSPTVQGASSPSPGVENAT